MGPSIGQAASQAANYLAGAEGLKFDALIDKAQEKAKALADTQAENKETLYAEQTAGDKPVVAEMKKKPLPKQAVRKTEKTAATDQKKPPEQIDKNAKEFSQSHQELGSEEDLKNLHYSLNDNDTPKEILDKVLAKYPKASQTSDALNFLALTTTGPLRDAVLKAKAFFDDKHAKEIEDGRPITEIARKGAEAGIDTARSLDAKISDMVAKQDDALVVFEQLLKEFPTKESRDKFIKLMLSTVGSQTRENIESPQLIALCTHIRKMQALIAPFSDFEKARSEMEMSFKTAGLEMPNHLSPENLTIAFYRLCSDRHYSSSKVMDVANRLAAAA